MSKEDIKKAAEESGNEVAIEAAADTEKYGSLEAVYLSEGGQLLAKNTIADIVSAIDTLSVQYKMLPHIEMIAICADLKTKLDMLRALANSPKNHADAMAALEEALRS